MYCLELKSISTRKIWFGKKWGLIDKKLIFIQTVSVAVTNLTTALVKVVEDI